MHLNAFRSGYSLRQTRATAKEAQRREGLVLVRGAGPDSRHHHLARESCSLIVFRSHGHSAYACLPVSPDGHRPPTSGRPPGGSHIHSVNSLLESTQTSSSSVFERSAGRWSLLVTEYIWASGAALLAMGDRLGVARQGVLEHEGELRGAELHVVRVPRLRTSRGAELPSNCQLTQTAGRDAQTESILSTCQT